MKLVAALDVATSYVIGKFKLWHRGAKFVSFLQHRHGARRLGHPRPTARLRAKRLVYRDSIGLGIGGRALNSRDTSRARYVLLLARNPGH